VSDPWIPDALCETHEWRSAAGEVVRFVTRTGATARMMPPITLDLLRVPQAHGARLRGARHEPRLVLLPVVVPAPQTTAGRTELRRWAKALDPAKGQGTLTVVQGASPGRHLNCVYEAGLDAMAEEWGQPLELAVLGFRAPDPYWLDATVVTQVLEMGGNEPRIVNTVTNTGDVDAWPVFTFHGPGFGIEFHNDSTGKTFIIDGPALVAGDVLVIDTRPARKSVTVNGASAFSRLRSGSVLWPLVPGVNQVSTFWSGDVAGTTSSAFVFNNRWLAA